MSIILKTKFLGATDFKGERISVNYDGEVKYIPYNYALNGFENHEKAVDIALRELNKSHGQQYEAFKAVKKLDGIFNLKTGFSVIV
jgi:hypothetical protein|tara:strand:- start:2142 stop:2399 length:258 start_codon:yes stop_codon:yes gene_type:complete